MTAAQLDRTPMGTRVVFTCGRLKGLAGMVVDVRHDGHHVRVRLDGGRTVTTRPGAIKSAAVQAGDTEMTTTFVGDWDRDGNTGPAVGSTVEAMTRWGIERGIVTGYTNGGRVLICLDRHKGTVLLPVAKTRDLVRAARPGAIKAEA